ncbi:MAG TPA: amino acid adenylation domain-containing protein [Herpetosiphonaceae bacterium]
MTRPQHSSFQSPERRKLFAALLAQEGLSSAAQKPIPRCNRSNDLPLSFAQQRLWFIHQLNPDSSAYNLSLAVRLQGPLDVGALTEALNLIIARHEALRTRFPAVDGEPVQVILPELKLNITPIDLRTTSASERESEAQRLANHLINQPFDLSQGPLLRAALLALEADDHQLLIAMHHIVADGWSMGILIRELTTLYEALSRGTPHPEGTSLPPLPIQYPDFASWQRTYMQDAVLEQQLSYWRQQMADAPPVLLLPTDHPRPPVQRFAGTNQRFVLPPPLTTALHELSRQAGATLFMTLLAAWQVLLHRYSGQDDIVVSTGIANRNRPETEPLIGCLINILLLRARLGGDPRFADVLRVVRQTVLEAQAHQDLPFEQLVEALQPVRDPSYSPLAQVMFVLHNEAVAVPDVASLKLRVVSPERVAAQYDLVLHITAQGDRLMGVLEYNTQIFEPNTIQRMIGHFQTLLQGLVADPTRTINSVPLLTAAEHQMLHEWNATGIDFPHDRCLHQLFEAHVQRQPTAIAAICGDERLSYHELNQRANQVAHELQARGVGPNVLVGLCMERSLDLVVALLGIAKAGGAYVPLDPAYPLERLQFMVEDTRAPVLLTQQHLVSRLPQHGVQIVSIDADWPQIAERSTEQPTSAVTATDLVYVIYTSGTTGRPKAVLLDHRGRVNNFCDFNRRFTIGPGDRVLALSSPSFDMSAYDVFGTLAAGGTIVLPSRSQERNPAHWSTLIHEHAVTIWHSAPALLELLVDHLAAQTDTLATSLRLALLGGDWIPVTLPDRLRALAPDVSVISLGGATEVSMDSTIYPIERTDPAWRSIPYGRPMANQRCYILDRQLQPVPIGVPGELHLGGVGVAWGYLNNPDLTAAKFIPNAFGDTPGERIYKTGDLARYGTDGTIELLGRMDFQVKIRGLRIELGEIEAALREHPTIKEGVVVARTADGDTRLVAYVVENLEPRAQNPEDDSDGSRSSGEHPVLGSTLRKFLAQRLPDYMVPSAFVVLNALPLTPNGKLDRRTLTHTLPMPAIERDAAAYLPPRNATEAQLAAVWSDVLHIDQIGIDDNFFELGGDSFKAIKVLQKLDGRATLVDLFRSPTIRALAETLATDQHATPPELLQQLTRRASPATISVVCVPYGGGSAIVYQPLADALPPEYELYAVALPGHDLNREHESLQTIAELAPAIVAAIRAKVHGPLILYGHCAGVALTIEIAKLLEAEQITISAIVLGGALPGARRSRTQSFLAKILPGRPIPSDEQVLAYLQQLGGFQEINDPAWLTFVTRTLGHDRHVATQYFEQLLQADAAPRLRAPIVCVMGDQDPLTAQYEQRFTEWAIFTESLSLAVISGGNHYFIKHQADELGRIIAALPGVPQAVETNYE